MGKVNSPFNEEKYRTLLNGLEAVELKLSDVLLDNKKFRFDSEFFKKEYLELEDLIKNKEHVKTKDVIEYLTDYHANGSYKTLKENVELLDDKDYALMVRTTDLERSDFYTNVKYLTENAYNFLTKTKVFGGEIIINKIGTNAGNIYLMPYLNRKVSLGMNQFMLKTGSAINNFYLYTFFSSNLGKKTLKRRVNGAAPFSIDKESILNINIPVFSDVLESKIESFILEHYKLIEDSKIIYEDAEKLLLEKLDLLNFDFLNQEYDENNILRKKGVTIKDISKSFRLSGRFDSEYYQPKYDNVVENVRSVNHNTLGKIVSIKKSIEPGSEAYQEEGIPFVRVSNLTKFGITKPDIYLSENLFFHNKLENLQPKKNTILLSKDGTIGIAYNMKEDSNIVTSGAILHLNIENDYKNDILPEYLTLVLNSLVVQLQSERDSGGSIIKHWKVPEIKAVLIPIIDMSIQIEIEKKIIESFNLKEKSRKLLEISKKAVEIAIEKNENEAINYINSKEN